MARLSNTVIAFINTLTLIISLAVIGVSVYSQVHGHSNCAKVLHYPILGLGLFLFLVSLLGLVGSCCRVSFLLFLYLFVLFLLIIGIIVFALFTLAITNKGVGQAISGRGFKEYRLGDYSNWLKNHVVNEKNWNGIRSCLIDVQVCKGVGSSSMTAEEFYQKKLSPIQSGCCKPPTSCDFTYQNATFWVIPKSGPKSNDSDCKTWSNQQEKLCYDCNSCKAGVLANMKKEWRIYAIISCAVLAFIIVVYGVGCVAFRSNRDRTYKRYRPYQ